MHLVWSVLEFFTSSRWKAEAKASKISRTCRWLPMAILAFAFCTTCSRSTASSSTAVSTTGSDCSCFGFLSCSCSESCRCLWFSCVPCSPSSSCPAPRISSQYLRDFKCTPEVTAQPVAFGSKSPWQVGQAHCQPGKDNPKVAGRLEFLHGQGQNQNRQGPPRLLTCDPFCRGRVSHCNCRLETTTAVVIPGSPTPFCTRNATPELWGDSSSHGSRSHVCISALDSASWCLGFWAAARQQSLARTSTERARSGTTTRASIAIHGFVDVWNHAQCDSSCPEPSWIFISRNVPTCCTNGPRFRTHTSCCSAGQYIRYSDPGSAPFVLCEWPTSPTGTTTQSSPRDIAAFGLSTRFLDSALQRKSFLDGQSHIQSKGFPRNLASNHCDCYRCTYTTGASAHLAGMCLHDGSCSPIVLSSSDHFRLAASSASFRTSRLFVCGNCQAMPWSFGRPIRTDLRSYLARSCAGSPTGACHSDRMPSPFRAMEEPSSSASATSSSGDPCAKKPSPGQSCCRRCAACAFLSRNPRTSEGEQIDPRRSERPAWSSQLHAESFVPSIHGWGVGLDMRGQASSGKEPAKPSPIGLSHPIRFRIADFLQPSSTDQKHQWTLRDEVAAVRQPWALDFLWRDFDLLCSFLPDFDPTLKHACASVPSWTNEPVKAVHIFTDGSAGISQTSSWAFVILFECILDESISFGFRFYGATGSLLRSRVDWIQSDNSVGEECHDALSAELCALTWALGWALQSRRADCFHFHFDNVAAGFGIFGQWQSTFSEQHGKLVRSAVSLRQMLATVATVVEGHHVKAHSLHPWNELVDACVKALARGILPAVSLPICVPRLLKHPFVAHAWMCLSDTSDVRPCVEWNAIFKHEGPTNSLVFDSHWVPPASALPLSMEDCPAAVLDFRIASANVLTLALGTKGQQSQPKFELGRVGYLIQQFHEQGLHVLGLQECRSYGQKTRHNAKYFVFQSGCSSSGTHGVEIWLSKTLPLGKCQKRPIFFQVNDFAVLDFAPRYLLLAVKSRYLQCHILCIHAPFGKSTESNPSDFWQELRQVVSKRHQQHWPLLVVGDFNARFGQTPSEAVGTHQAEEETETSQLAHAFLLDFDLCLPATFAQYQKNDGFTWHIGLPGQSRIDFVAVPQSWLSSVQSAQVLLDLDLISEADHQAVCLDLAMHCRSGLSRSTPKLRLSPHKLKDPSRVMGFMQDLQQLTSVPWTSGVGVHCELLVSTLQSLAHKHFPADTKPQHRPFLTSSTWDLITARHALHRTCDHLTKLVHRVQALRCLRLWRQSYALRLFLQSRQSSPQDPSPLLGLDLPAMDLAVHRPCASLISQVKLLKVQVILLRKRLHKPVRNACKADKLAALKQAADRFAHSASLADPAMVHRLLKPLLGSHGRKPLWSSNPLPAIRTSDGTLARSHEEIAQTWQAYFGHIEGGNPVTPIQLKQRLETSARLLFPTDQTPTLDMQALPTLYQVEAVIRRSRAGKAPGPDGLPSSLFRLAPTQFARLLFPLYLKIGLRCCEPLRFRGGEVIALAKRAQSALQCSDFRSIVLADQIGKYHHTMQRHRLLPNFEQFRASTQAGCVPKFGVDFIHLQLESYAAWAHQCNRSLCVLFLDVSSAYYRTCKEFILGDDMTDEHIAKLFAQNGWSPALLHEFIATLQEPGSLHQAGVSQHHQAQIRSCLISTWFSLRQHSNTLTSTTKGTRPGDPLADLLFAFLFSRFLHAMQSKAELANLLDFFPVRWIPGGRLTEEEHVLTSPFHGTWADDVFLACTSDTASALLPRAQDLATIAIDTAATFGLSLNYGTDKTIALLIPRGAGTNAVLKFLAAPNPVLSLRTRALGATSVKISKDYVHLGTLFNGISPSRDIRRRLTLTQPLVRHLRRSVFGCTAVAITTRCHLFKSYVLSRFMHNFSTLHFHTQQDAQLWITSVLHLYQALLPPGSRGPGFHTLDLLASSKQLSPSLLASKHRLALFSRFLTLDLPCLLGILQATEGAPGWSALVLHDLRLLRSYIPEASLWTSVDLSSFEDTCKWFVQCPKSLRSLQTQAEKRFQLYLQLWQSLQTFRTAVFQRLTQHGVLLDSPEGSQPLFLEHVCTQCQRGFETFHGLTSHLRKFHGLRNVARKYAIGNTCRQCLVQYHDRTSLIYHLKHLRTSCLIRLIQTVPPLSDEEVQALDHQDAEESKKLKYQLRQTYRYPATRVAGPLRPSLWRSLTFQALPPGAEVSNADLAAWLHSFWDSLVQNEQGSLFALLDTTPCDRLHVTSVLAFVESQIADFEALPRISIGISLHTAMQHWFLATSLSGSSLSWCNLLGDVKWDLLSHVRLPALSSLPSSSRTELSWMHALQQPFQIVHQMRLQHQKDNAIIPGWSAPARSPSCQTIVLAYLFSGRRREGDFQEHAQAWGWRMGYDVRVLLIDLALSREHDMLDPGKFLKIQERIRTGEIAAVLMAPPCETWSVARSRRPADDDENWPRVIRQQSVPWCDTGLKEAELRQLTLANDLLYVAILLVIECLLCGVRFVLEHPAEPSGPQKGLPSIWKSWPLQWIMQHPSVQRYLVHQSNFGARSRKPTHLLTGGIQDFEQVMASQMEPTPEANLETLQGRDETGFRTRLAKEYPSAMNKALALLMLHSTVASWSEQPPRAALSPEFREFLTHLEVAQLPKEQQEMQPDYAKGHESKQCRSTHLRS